MFTKHDKATSFYKKKRKLQILEQKHDFKNSIF